jgi:hypothetical protein
MEETERLTQRLKSWEEVCPCVVAPHPHFSSLLLPSSLWLPLSPVPPSVSAFLQQKRSLGEAKSLEASLKAKLEQLNWEHEVLLQRCGQEERDRDELQEAFEREAYAILQSALLHGMLMVKKMQRLDEIVERKVGSPLSSPPWHPSPPLVNPPRPSRLPPGTSLPL